MELFLFYLRENVSKRVKGAWRFCTNDLVTASAVKVALFILVQFCSAKRQCQAIVVDIITL
jgi:hypothetical protein